MARMISRAGMFRPPRVFKSAGLGVGSSRRKSGETHEQICDQAFDAGDVLDGAGRGARAHIGLCRGRRQSGAAGVGRHQGKKKKSDKSSSIDDPQFLAGYRAAYATIYDRHDYAAAIEQLKALGHDDRADVANLIGYSYRKLGDYKVSQIWYERALKADPNHVGPGSITGCGSSNRATAIRRNIT